MQVLGGRRLTSPHPPNPYALGFVLRWGECWPPEGWASGRVGCGWPSGGEGARLLGTCPTPCCHTVVYGRGYCGVVASVVSGVWAQASAGRQHGAARRRADRYWCADPSYVRTRSLGVLWAERIAYVPIGGPVAVQVRNSGQSRGFCGLRLRGPSRRYWARSAIPLTILSSDRTPRTLTATMSATNSSRHHGDIGRVEGSSS